MTTMRLERGRTKKRSNLVSALKFIKPRLRQFSSKLGPRRQLLGNAVSELNSTVSTYNRSMRDESALPEFTDSVRDLPTKRSSMFVGIPVDEETGAYAIVTGETPLHLALHEQPPLSFVTKLIEDCPERISQQNVLGMTPLHIAAGSGASPSALECLVKACPVAVGAQDYKLRVPLHLLCMNTNDCDTGNSYGDKVKGPFLPAIKILLKVEAPNVNVEDVYGKTALEYAIESDASIQVIKTLHKASEKEWKSKKHCSMTILARGYSKDCECTFDISGAQSHPVVDQSPKPHAVHLQRHTPAISSTLLSFDSLSNYMPVLSLSYTRTRRRGALDMRGSYSSTGA